MRYIRRFLALTSLLLALVACTSGGAQTQGTPTASRPSPTPTPGIPSGTLLFQVDWSQGLSGWSNSHGWTIVQGAAQSDSGANDTLTLPYMPSTPNYAFEISFQVVSVSDNGGEFAFQALPTKNKDGYVANVLNLLGAKSHSEFDHPQIQIYTHSLTNGDGSFHPAVYLPGTAPHTFRLAVQGSEVNLFADGIGKGSAVSDQADQLSSGPLQILASGIVMRVSSVRITAL